MIAQDPATAYSAGMPSSAIRSGAVDYVMPLDAIGPFLATLTSARSTGQTNPLG